MNANEPSIKIGDRVRFVSDGYSYPYLDDCGTVIGDFDPVFRIRWDTLPCGSKESQTAIRSVHRKHITVVVPAESERAA